MDNKAFAALLMLTVLSGCATERYGRLTPVGQVERQHLSCEQIALEIAKCDEFIASTTAQSKEFTSTDVLAILGDFGIGNSMEYQAAIKSGKTRRAALVGLQATKQCISTVDDEVARTAVH